MDGNFTEDWTFQTVDNRHSLRLQQDIGPSGIWYDYNSPQPGYALESNMAAYGHVSGFDTLQQQQLGAIAAPAPMPASIPMSRTSTATASTNSIASTVSSGYNMKATTRHRPNKTVRFAENQSLAQARPTTFGEIEAYPPVAYDSFACDNFGGCHAFTNATHSMVLPAEPYQPGIETGLPQYAHQLNNCEFVNSHTPTSSTDSDVMSRNNSSASIFFNDASQTCDPNSSSFTVAGFKSLEASLVHPLLNSSTGQLNNDSFLCTSSSPLRHPTCVGSDGSFPQFPISYYSSDCVATASCLPRRDATDVSFSSSSSYSSGDVRTTASKPRNAQPRSEQATTYGRQLAPKPTQGESKTVACNSSDDKAKQLSQEVGDKRAIPHAQPAYRPKVHEKKLRCYKCSDQPQFKGKHELSRHMLRNHSIMRKAIICVEKDPDGTFLANCKSCRNGKRYYIDYNAAAHLRRAHFNKQSRIKGAPKTSEKLGGKSGGNSPPMEVCKQWMREVEEFVPENFDMPADENDSDHDSPTSPYQTKVESPLLDGDSSATVDDSDVEWPMDYAPMDYEPVDHSLMKSEPVDYAPMKSEPVDYEPMKYEPMGYESYQTLESPDEYWDSLFADPHMMKRTNYMACCSDSLQGYPCTCSCMFKLY